MLKHVLHTVEKVVNSFSLRPGAGVGWGELILRAQEITLTQRGAHMHEQDCFGPSSNLSHFHCLFVCFFLTNGCVRREVSEYFN